MTFRLEARSLACERDDRWLFSDLDVDVGDGEIVRIEGPNGSGKTTLLKILSGQMADFQGELRWCGQPMRKVRDDFLTNLLYMGHSPGVKAALSPLENLAWFQALAGERGAAAARMRALSEVGLTGFEDIPATQLSAGQQRRIALARLVLIERPLWILDEPFTAIDRDGVAELERRLLMHVRRGGSVLLTTHHDLTPVGELRRIRLGRGAAHVDE